MIQPQSVLKIIDNSGAKEIRCIKVLGGSKRRYASIGDLIVGSVIQIHPTKKNPKVKKGQVVRALVVGTKQPVIRRNGQIIKFDTSIAVLLNDKNTPIGTRIIGPVARELRLTKHSKIVSLATQLV